MLDLDKKAKTMKDDIEGMKKKFENKAKKYDAWYKNEFQTKLTNQYQRYQKLYAQKK